MANEISEKAYVSPKAKIGNNCKIFPFAYIEDDVEIGDNCIIFPFVSILNGTKMGSGNKIHQGAVLGALPQDFDFCGEKTELVVGNNNIIRENVVINRATHAGGQTVIGDDNFLMEGAHISHDTKIGNKCVLGYGTKIAGSCEIHDGVIFSSSVIENANTRVGKLAMIQAGTTFSKDVPPYVVVGGKPVTYGGPNNTMMTVADVSPKVQKHIANAYRLVFHGQNSVFDSVLQIESQIPDSSEIRYIVEFIKGTKAGIVSKK
ncbi:MULTISPECIES: acyl-ACP--UDP-N-acetylglucosamine O-acyltransferase [Segatella]|uniref:Acyl-(Acyl-carrier-protein)-UDP-N-acetylglucosamine O-acyltransferase n=2 Tax=Segatella TaxID=2974251 RepID=D8DVR9_9BACT|nr:MULTISPECIES: acyl-ACP--UDP-N-acetylglucosamine O-acyltransferase [Segatella]EFI72526.1 acyl-(acyl-carrier-protein)-UDP-N-acetylglucosamine O-acyltransferase [Segatella baroniae B14]UKK77608.1 acyl-ACP--UDP-N-acetylglucosamine O-acyltransferase [Segatella baroniae B14]GJG28128.1 acyl-[acyl-carrier-protein]--UDP-N-acetylglucosamine O-acyltransferase [Segatella bryantii]SEQ60496.1 UDP-N-acetylglucosamine acyltransferase [Segatella baroniae B14]